MPPASFRLCGGAQWWPTTGSESYVGEIYRSMNAERWRNLKPWLPFIQWQLIDTDEGGCMEDANRSAAPSVARSRAGAQKPPTCAQLGFRHNRT